MQSFLDVLSQIRGGAALTDAAKDLQELVQAVRDTGKPGKLSFSITVEPDKADDSVVTLQPDVTLKLPKKARAKGVFYMDRHGTLTREDDYINRFKNADTMIFADIASDTIVSVIDYHKAPENNGNPAAALSAHRATLTLPKSLEWQTWTRASGQLKSHVEFATFLEENAIDIKNPVGADLLELCRDLQVAQNVNFGSSVRMGDLTQINYQKEQDAMSKGSIALPQSIMLSIPVYFGEPAVAVMAFLRRQIDDGKLKLGIQLSRAENVRQEEFHRVVDWVSAEVKNLTTVYGTPA